MLADTQLKSSLKSWKCKYAIDIIIYKGVNMFLLTFAMIRTTVICHETWTNAVPATMTGLGIRATSRPALCSIKLANTPGAPEAPLAMY